MAYVGVFSLLHKSAWQSTFPSQGFRLAGDTSPLPRSAVLPFSCLGLVGQLQIRLSCLEGAAAIYLAQYPLCV